jgi:hypothetical protein
MFCTAPETTKNGRQLFANRPSAQGISDGAEGNAFPLMWCGLGTFSLRFSLRSQTKIDAERHAKIVSRDRCTENAQISLLIL